MKLEPTLDPNACLTLEAGPVPDVPALDASALRRAWASAREHVAAAMAPSRPSAPSFIGGGDAVLPSLQPDGTVALVSLSQLSRQGL